MSLQRLELKRRPKLKSRIELMANGISMVFHPFIPDIQVRGQHESLPQKSSQQKIQLFQFWWYLFGGYTSSIHGLKGLCLVTKATKCTILGSFPGTCLCIAATHHGGRSRSYGIGWWFSPFHVFQVIHWPGESKAGHLLVEVSGLKMFL